MIERIEPTNRIERNTICNDQRIGEKIYDYYNGVLEPEDVRTFEQHLIQCGHCEKVVLELDHIYFSLEDAEMEKTQTTSPPGSDRLRVEQLQRQWRKRS